MKAPFFSLIALTLITFSTFSQEKQSGFYVNPNFSIGSLALNTNQNSNVIWPSIGLGYLCGDSKRHNISIAGINLGIAGKSSYQFGMRLRYSMDYLLYNKGKFKFYLSPYLLGNVNASLSKSYTSTGIQVRSRANNYSISGGVSSQLEYAASKRIHLTFGLPIQTLSYSFSTQKDQYQLFSPITGQYETSTHRNQVGNIFITPSFNANVGIRISILNKIK